ncbi:MAG: GDP-mannose 4,6-dehydratase [Thermoanaerobaculia bacterium]
MQDGGRLLASSARSIGILHARHLGNMRVLITGLAGFLGRHLARELQAHGWQVAGTVLAERAGLPGVEELHADVTEAAALRRVVESWEPEAVVHLAGLTHVGSSWQQMPEYFRVNVEGTANLLDAFAGEPVEAPGGRRVVFASSAEVYGRVPEAEQPIGEDRAPAPRSPYALTKAAAELLMRRARAVTVRSFNIVGPGQAESFALPSFARQLAAIARGESEPTLRVGNLEARRDFLHVADAVRAFRLLLERGEPGTTYNLGSGQALSIHEALGRLMAVSGVAAEVEVDPERLRPVDVPLLEADTSRLRALGWQPEGTLDDALRALWESVR